MNPVNNYSEHFVPKPTWTEDRMRNECYHNCGKKSGPCQSVCGQSSSLTGLTERLDGHCCSKNIVDSPECPLSAVQSVEYDGFICMTLQRLVSKIFLQNVLKNVANWNFTIVYFQHSRWKCCANHKCSKKCKRADLRPDWHVKCKDYPRKTVYP